MPTINKIRLTNVVYEDGDKRFNDDTFLLDGHNAAIVLENGGGKTVFIHTVLQAILPHTHLGERKIRETLKLDQAPAHIAIEWIINDRPRRYLVTAVSLFINNDRLESYRYTFEYEANHPDRIENIPFVIEMETTKRPASKEEIREYYSQMSQTIDAHTFDTLGAFHEFIEDNYNIIHNEWESIVKINEDEGGIEKFFERCRTTTDLYDRLLIPTVEDSIAGHNKDTFADTFEKQRKAFQKYHELQKSMEEHRLIQEQLESYVQEVKKYTNKKDNYLETKQHAKGLLEAVISDRITMEKQQEENERNWNGWKEHQQFHEVKQSSFEILQQQEKASNLEKVYQGKTSEKVEVEEKFTEAKNTYDSLRYAKAKGQLTAYKQLKKDLEIEIEKQDEYSDVEELEQELATENAKLHGHFISKIEQIKKEMDGITLERQPLERTLTKLAKRKQQNEEQESTTRARLNHVLGQIQSEQRTSKDLWHKLISHEQDDIHVEYEKWIERHEFVDQEIIQVNEWIKGAKQNVKVLFKEQRELSGEKHELDLLLREKKSEQDQLRRTHDELIEQLARIRPNWQSIADLYLQKASVRETLLELQRTLNRKRDDLLTRERLALRFVDDYGKQDLFVSDPYLAGRLQRIQENFFVYSGAEYYETLSVESQEALRDYYLWPLTLVTTGEHRERLLSKLRDMGDRLQYPVTVLTVDEVTQMETRAVDGSWIAPDHWVNNLERDQFDNWKAVLQEEAYRVVQERVEQEAVLENHQAVIRQFNAFFEKYPSETNEQLRDKIRECSEGKERIERQEAELHEKVMQTERKMSAAEEKVVAYENEMNGLARRIERAQEYFQVERELARLTEARDGLEQQVTELERSISKLVREIERYQEDISLLDDKNHDLKIDLRTEENADLYIAVRDEQPIFSDEEKAVLVNRRENLQNKILGIEQTYGELRIKYEQVKSDIDREQRTMDGLLLENEQINILISFPVDGERMLEQTRRRMREMDAAIEILADEVSGARSAFERQDELVKHYLERFRSEFPTEEVYSFEESIENIELSLLNEGNQLAERKSYLSSEENRVARELSDIEEAESLLEKYAYAHKFDVTVITAIPLTASEQTEFTYARKSFAERMGGRLEAGEERLKRGEDQIDRAKAKFRRFIHREITEPKLRNMAQEGIDTKTTYDDILSHQGNMLKTLESANQYARDFISQNDELIQVFISNIHNHLTTVVEQLQVIPRHTRVRVDDKWQEVYRFNIPEWSEEDGKNRIREYMEWILGQLETERFKDEQGLEDTGKIRKEIETWLDTRQLLQVVMEQKMMRVSCRKVTNDNNVSKRLTTWEQSNRWSGGEKWSKNMTLFLGILNFVAEKQQHQRRTMKRHRAVILDNPFGKASSDHVLSPVFFIAEQLGFQIIALTAHADGKFLQDYFPIIYSLRLRTASDGRKQVVDKTKSLHYAYFQDHDPEAMERLKEREQMKLF